MIHDLFAGIAKLSARMRLYLAIQSADTDTGELRDRDMLILELLKSQGSLRMTELWRFFPGVKPSTLSTDIKRLRGELGYVDMHVDKSDMRVHRIELSEKGLARVRELKAQRAKSYIPLARAIGKSPEEIELLQRIVDRTITLLEKEITRFAESKKQPPALDSAETQLFAGGTPKAKQEGEA